MTRNEARRRAARVWGLSWETTAKAVKPVSMGSYRRDLKPWDEEWTVSTPGGNHGLDFNGHVTCVEQHPSCREAERRADFPEQEEAFNAAVEEVREKSGPEPPEGTRDVSATVRIRNLTPEMAIILHSNPDVELAIRANGITVLFSATLEAVEEHGRG